MLVGHSYGGGVALAVARLAPERAEALVLLASVGPGCLTGWGRLLAAPVAGEVCAGGGVVADAVAGPGPGCGSSPGGADGPSPPMSTSTGTSGATRTTTMGWFGAASSPKQRALVGEVSGLTAPLADVAQPVLLVADPHDTLIPVSPAPA